MRCDVDTGGRRNRSRVFGAVEIRGIYKSGMGHYLPCVTEMPPIDGPLPA